MELFMAPRISFLRSLLGSAFLLCGTVYGAQDPATVPSQRTVPSASLTAQPQQDTGHAAVKEQPPTAAAPDTVKKPAKATPPSAPAVSQPKTLQKKKTIGEDILDEEDLILPEKGVDLPAPKASAQVPPAAAPQTMPGADSARPAADTNGAKAVTAPPAAPSSGSAAGASPPATTAAANQGTQPAVVKIEDARPINFARNLKEYRSPKLAMLLSLAIPGLGQVYIGKKSNYLKAGAYVAVEAAIIGASAYYFNKGDTKYNQAKNYANANYSFDSMLVYYNKLFSFFKNDPHQNLDNSMAQGKLNDIYIDTITDTASNFFKSYNNNHPSQEYYHTIENSEYIHGWRGCEPSLDDIEKVSSGDTINVSGYQFLYQRAADSVSFLVNLIDRTTGRALTGSGNELQFGYSPYQREYKTMMDESNKFYKTATYVLFVILVNHVVSAVDALISAKAYNDGLLGKQTFWDNLSVQPTTAFSGQYLSPGLSMRIRF
jgi:hypothetical protein